MDEHDPRFDPSLDDLMPHDWASFLAGIGRAVLLALAAAGVATFLGGCSTIDPQNRVEGWPDLQVTEFRVAYEEMRSRCDRYVAFGMIPLACAEFNLNARSCHIWLDRDYAPAHIVEHERMHCSGHDHFGSTHMADMYKQWSSR